MEPSFPAYLVGLRIVDTEGASTSKGQRSRYFESSMAVIT